jgi:hypothetical protein
MSSPDKLHGTQFSSSLVPYNQLNNTQDAVKKNQENL